jgi:Lrp/AsnC family transcriptional regulator for asnA, asnC and gidA
MKTIPEILECHYTTGNWSVLIKILCKDNEDLMLILNKKIQSIKGVSQNRKLSFHLNNKLTDKLL